MQCELELAPEKSRFLMSAIDSRCPPLLNPTGDAEGNRESLLICHTLQVILHHALHLHIYYALMSLMSR